MAEKPRRWSRKRLALVGTPLVILALAAAVILPTLWKAKGAYDRIFDAPAPRYRVTVNAEGTIVTDPHATEAVDLPDWDKKERINILLLGVDTREDGEIPRSDTIIIVTIDPATRQVGMLSIPRDLEVTIPDHGEDKINAAYPAGSQSDITGAGLVRETIEHNFGITIHYVAEVDFQGFQKIVNTLGGITLDVPAPIKDDQYPGEQFNYTRVYFSSGIQHMDGKTALRYARTRHDDNDFARGNRQQQVLMALRQQGISFNLLSKAPKLIEEMGDTVHTDIPPGDALRLAKLASEIKPEDIHSYNLLGATTESYSPGAPYYLLPDWDKIHQIFSEMMPPSATPAPQPTTTPAPTPTTRAETATAPPATQTPVSSPSPTAAPNLAATILVQNATRVNQLAATNAAKLGNAGFASIDTGQSPQTGNYPTSQIIVYNGDLAAAQLIADTLGLPQSAVVEGDQANATGYDLVVVLGDDAPALTDT